MLAGAGILVVGYGWRHGFSDLPEPAPAATGALAWPGSEGDLPSTNFWYHVRALTRSEPQLAADASQAVVLPRPRGPARSGVRGRAVPYYLPEPALPPEDRLPWLDERPEITAALEAALAAPDRRAPANLRTEELVAFKLLVAAASWRAEAAEQSADAPAAFRHLLACWTLHSAVVPPAEFPELFDERGGEELNETLARPFRRLAMVGPALGLAETREILAALASLGRNAGGPEAAFLRALDREAARIGAARIPDWGRVGRAVRMAGLLVRQDAGRLVMDLLERMLGRRYGGEPNYHGVAHGIRPVAEFLVALQTLAARDKDFDAMAAACVTRTLDALQRRRLPPRSAAPAWLPDAVSACGLWRRWFDRPAVWRLTEVLPDPRTALESWQQWQVGLESCRLTLALRAFHDRCGRWPDRLEELTPGLLEAVPRDPFGDGPFRYERTGESWRFWSVGPEGRDPGREQWDQVPQRVFRSTEFQTTSSATDPIRR